MVASPTAFIVDDDSDLRQSVHWMLATAGLNVQSFASGPEFLSQFDPDDGGCLVLDIRMPRMSGIEVLHHLRERGWSIPTIIVTAHADIPTAVRAVKDGAIDFLEKPFERNVLLSRIREALECDAAERRIRQEINRIRDRLETLTRREREVMDHLVEGRISKQIALQLGCSVRTIECHRARVMKKVGARSVAELVRLVLTVRGPNGALETAAT